MTFAQCMDERRWNALVKALPEHGIYQSWNWGELRAGPQRDVRRFALFESGLPRAAASVELRRMQRLPFRVAYAPRGPLWVDTEHLLLFASHLSSALKREGVLYLKVNPSGDPVRAAALQQAGFAPVPRPDLTFGGILPHLTARLPLATVREVYRAMEPEARRRVRQAERRGILVESASSAEQMAEFYPWLLRTAQRQGFGLPPEGALRAMAGAWLRRREGMLFLARHEGAPIGGALCSFFGDEGCGHFLADDPAQRSLSAVYALYAAGIEEAARRGCRFFDLGGIRAADDADGLFRFKRQFGASAHRHLGEWNLPLSSLWYRVLTRVSHGALPRHI